MWFVSWQHTGHIKALCPIASELQRRGWNVRLAVHDEVAHQVPRSLQVLSAGSLPWTWEEELEFRHALWDPPLPPKPGGAEEAEEEARSAQKAELSERYFLGSQRSLAQGLRETLNQTPRQDWPMLLVVDVSSVGAMDLAEILDIPYAVVSSWPVGPTLQSVADPSALMHPWMPSELFAFTQSEGQQGLLDRVKRAIVTVALPMFMELAGFHKPRRELREELGLPSSKVELLEAPAIGTGNDRPLIVTLSHWGFDRPRPLPPNVVLVGPVEAYDHAVALQEPLQDSIAAWLGQDGFHSVYVSFGTNAEPRPHMLRELLAGMAELEAIGIRFLWDVDEAEVQAKAGLAASAGHGLELVLPANILFAPALPQLPVLASGRLSAFVSHCGMNSVHEAAHFGVPIIGVPFLGDQLISARLIAEAGAGVRLSTPTLSAASFTHAVRTVVFDSDFQRAAAKVGSLGRLAGGAHSAAMSLEAVALYGTGHLQTIAQRHPQAGRMWDVRLAIAGVPMAAGLIFWWSTRALSGRGGDPPPVSSPRCPQVASPAGAKLSVAEPGAAGARKKKSS